MTKQTKHSKLPLQLLTIDEPQLGTALDPMKNTARICMHVTMHESD